MKSRKFSIPARLRSFKYAFQGFRWMIRDEHNSWIHLGIVSVLLPVCFVLKLSIVEWALIVISIGIVLTAELINSAIERLADRLSTEHDEGIGKIKDIAAAAVLISAIAAAIVGLIILVPKILLFIKP